MIRLKNLCGPALCLVLFFASLIIFFSVFFTTVYPDLTYTEPYSHTSCDRIALEISSFPCCDLTPAAACGACEENFLREKPCQLFQSNFTSISSCCSVAPRCCYSVCSNCSRIDYVSVSIPCTCQGTGKSARNCPITGCTEIVPVEVIYPCNCTCLAPVQNFTSSLACGQCANLTGVYRFRPENSKEFVNQTITKQCTRDTQSSCVEPFQREFPLESSFDCWYSNENPFLSPVLFSYQNHGISSVGLAYSIVSGLFIVFSMASFLLECWKIRKSFYSSRISSNLSYSAVPLGSVEGGTLEQLGNEEFQ